MPIKKRDLRKTLCGKFKFRQVPGSKHEAVALIYDGKKVATTRFSRSHREIDDSILGRIAKQLRVNLSFLKGMHDCTKSQRDYLKRLSDGGFLM